MKKRLERRCLPMNIAIFLRTPILKNIFKRQLLQWESWSNLGDLIKPLKYFLQCFQSCSKTFHNIQKIVTMTEFFLIEFAGYGADTLLHSVAIFCVNSLRFSQKNYFSEPVLMNLPFQFHVKVSRSSHRRCSIKKELLKILQNSQGNTCAKVSFLTKLQSSGLQLY